PVAENSRHRCWRIQNRQRTERLVYCELEVDLLSLPCAVHECLVLLDRTGAVESVLIRLNEGARVLLRVGEAFVGVENRIPEIFHSRHVNLISPRTCGDIDIQTYISAFLRNQIANHNLKFLDVGWVDPEN